MTKKVEVLIENEFIKVNSPYNAIFVKKAKEIGGKWEFPYWKFKLENKEVVEGVLLNIYGEKGNGIEEEVELNVHLDEIGSPQTLWIGTLPICSRQRRDGAVRLEDGVIVIKGGFPGRGGSAKYPQIDPEEGTVLNVKHFPKVIYDKIEDKSGLELLSSTSVGLSQEDLIKEKEELEKEKERIINRIRDIEQQLENKKNSL